MNANILHPNPVSTRQFTFDSATRQFVSEISSTFGFGRVYADACDEGLTLVSATTGQQVVFVVDRIDRDGEGDIKAWHLIPADRSAPPAIKGLTMTLFND